MQRSNYCLAAIVLMLAGCATPMEMTAEDKAECAAVPCTAWSERQLGDLAKHFYRRGFVDGRKAEKGAL